MSASNSNLRPSRRPPSGVALTLVTLLWWFACREVAERAATGLLGTLAGGAFVSLLASIFLLFLVVLGFLATDMLRGQRASLRSLLSLPKRATSSREWLIGAALGWGAVVIAVLPLALRRALYVQTWFAPRGVLAALLSLATLIVATLTAEAVFRGYAFRRLESSLGPNRAMLLLSAAYALIVSFPLGRLMPLLISFLFAVLLTSAWRRTHALWMSWGLHFAWSAALGVLFGLPLFGGTELSNIIQAQAQGSIQLTGRGMGPIAAPWTLVVIAGSIFVLIWSTRDFAWAYTHPPIIAAGYPMTVPPPPEHAAMETSVAPPPLVQILPNTPRGETRIEP